MIAQADARSCIPGISTAGGSKEAEYSTLFGVAFQNFGQEEAQTPGSNTQDRCERIVKTRLMGLEGMKNQGGTSGAK